MRQEFLGAVCMYLLPLLALIVWVLVEWQQEQDRRAGRGDPR